MGAVLLYDNDEIPGLNDHESQDWGGLECVLLYSIVICKGAR